MVSLDTTVFASYYLWRGWLVAYRRKRGADSLALHGKAIRAGLLCTMTIINQRAAQFVVIAMRKIFLTLLIALPATWPFVHSIGNAISAIILDHNVILSLTTVFPYGWFFLALVDGPRSVGACKVLALAEDDFEDLFGSRSPSTVECLFWRCRVPVYLVLRAVVTSGWTADPLVPSGAE